jgi:hypothetical protein
MRFAVLMLAVGAGAVAAGAEGILFDAPVSGIVHDRVHRTLVPVLGVPGAASLGKPLLEDVDRIAAAPDGSSALQSSESGLALIQAIHTGQPVIVPLLDSPVELVAWAQDSSAAALYLPASRSICIVTFEQNSFRLLRPIDAGGFVTALAVANGGRRVAAIVRSGDTSLLTVFSQSAM